MEPLALRNALVMGGLVVLIFLTLLELMGEVEKWFGGDDP
jgi:hypothetical protein